MKQNVGFEIQIFLLYTVNGKRHLRAHAAEKVFY